MSDETKCPFEVGQWVTDEEVVAIVTSRAPERFVCNAVMVKPQGGYDCGDPEDADSWSTHGRINDWSRWVAFDPSDVVRVAELERYADLARRQNRIIGMAEHVFGVANMETVGEMASCWDGVEALGEFELVPVMLPRDETATCPICNETTPRGWPCGCDDGRE